MGAAWSRHDGEPQPPLEMPVGKDTAETSLSSSPEVFPLRELLAVEPDIMEAGPAPEPKAPEPGDIPEPDPVPTPEPAHEPPAEAAPGRCSFIQLACCCDPMDEDMPDPYDDGKDLNLDFTKPHVDPVTGGRFLFCPPGHGAHCHATNCGAPILDPGERPAYIAAYRARLRQAQKMGKI